MISTSIKLDRDDKGGPTTRSNLVTSPLGPPPPLFLGESAKERSVAKIIPTVASSAVVTPRPSSSSGPLQVPWRTAADLDAAHLLASVASIVSHEVSNEDCNGEKFPRTNSNIETPTNDKDLVYESQELLCYQHQQEEKQEAFLSQCHVHLPKFSVLQRETEAPTRPRTNAKSLNPSFRARSISLDTADAYLPSDLAYIQSSYETSDKKRPSTFVSVPTFLVSPPSSPSSPSRTTSKKRTLDDLFDSDNGENTTTKEKAKTLSRKRFDQVNASTVFKKHKGIVQSVGSIRPKNKKIKMIFRSKFSWRNWPELEAFLVANREEYLRHSALNYTIQQKNYNNELTQRLIQLASASGYVFDENAFDFVTIRDRIRCYYKSFVQSRKKQGVVVGYAARKAGLIAEDELQKIASSKNLIILPTKKKRKGNTNKNRK